MHKRYPSSTRFADMMSSITDDTLTQFLDYRRWLMIESPSSICMPQKVVWRTPFVDSPYIHAQLMPNFLDAPWPDLFKADPRNIVDPDPTAPSRYRPTGLACWDTAIALPDSVHGANLLPATMRVVPALRKCNTFWQEYQHMLHRVGRLIPKGPILRYASPWTIDLTQMGDVGWRILEAAHVLTHMQLESKVSARNLSKFNFDYHNTLSSMLTKLVVGYLFDIPVDVSKRNLGLYGYPDMEYYGISVRMTTDMFEPKLRTTIAVREAPRPDKAIIYILASVHIEPTPYNYEGKEVRTEDYEWHDRFACKPTVVTILGWESVDVLTHQQRIDTSSYGPNYVMPAYDLMPPYTLWFYLKLCEKRWGRPPTGEYYGLATPEDKGPVTSKLAYVGDWIEMNNPEYWALFKHTPSFPCQYCYTTNFSDKNAKRRPFGRVPPDYKIKRGSPWFEYLKARNKILKLTAKPVIDYETMLYDGRGKALALRRLRKQNYALIDQCNKYDRLVERAAQSRFNMSARQLKILDGVMWMDGRLIVTDSNGQRMIVAAKGKEARYIGPDGKPLIV